MAKEIIYRKDYQAPDFLIENVYLEFDLTEEFTVVKSKIEFYKNNDKASDCVLLADELTFISVSMNGELLSVEDFILSEDKLIIKNAPDKFVLEVENSINPLANTALEGLYASSGNLCTQCEPEGFRRIAYYPDRSDVMAKFTVKLIADKAQYPVLLSNGNEIEAGNLENGKHYVVFEDPFRKPSYLFALVAGTLDSISDTFTTMSGKKIDLHIYCNVGNTDKCGFAMEALKNAMKWDEEVFGREYDLNIFNVVVVDDFNAGAMENKSLNIFNSTCALASPKTATDANYEFIEKVIGHEYFHNWSGDRVTCQSWFELTLKEGLTVFRDQEFSADMQDRGTQRISDILKLRNFQLPEDMSPMAHAIRPDSYMQINNFYTKTVYEKGAEVIRMMQTILGKEKFRQGADIYFDKFDGQAVTCDDFVSCMEKASDLDLTHFKLWYSQAGTPVVSVKTHWDKENRTYKITLSQKTEETNNQQEKQALYIPMKTGILNHEGEEIDLIIDGENLGKETVLILDQDEKEFIFEQVNSQPAPSLFRGLSAPIILNTDLTMDDYVFLMAHDTDSFNRWDSAQKFAMDIIMNGLNDPDNLHVPKALIKAFKEIIDDKEMDDQFKALMLTLPSMKEIAGFCEKIDPAAIHKVKKNMVKILSENLNHEFMEMYGKTTSLQAYEVTHQGMGKRALHNLCLSYLCAEGSKGALSLAENQYLQVDNLTEQFSAMQILINKANDKVSQTIVDNFYEIYKEDKLVLNKWFVANALSTKDDALDRVKSLKNHEAFDIKYPNNVRALLGAFSMNNMLQFHREDGEGYKFIADCVIELNSINPHVAGSLVDALCSFAKFDDNRKGMMVAELKRISSVESLSSNVTEKIDNALKTV